MAARIPRVAENYGEYLRSIDEVEGPRDIVTWAPTHSAEGLESKGQTYQQFLVANAQSQHRETGAFD